MTTPRSRTAAEIATTSLGARPLPELSEAPLLPELGRRELLLDNGLRVLALRMPTVPLVELRLSVPFSGTDLTHSARSQLLASTLLCGTAARDRFRLDSDLAAVGADLGAGVSPERLTIGGSVLAEGFPELLGLFAEVLIGADYPDAEVFGERERTLAGLKVHAARPGTMARKALLRKAFGRHPISREVPDLDQVEAVTPQQVRDLHHRALVPRGSVLVVVGDLDPDETVDRIGSALHGWDGFHDAQTIVPFDTIAPGALDLVDRRDAGQSQIRLIGNGVSKTDRRYASAKLANLVFGGYFSSRLMENVREDKGYTYGASSSLDGSCAGDTLSVSLDTGRATTAAALLETSYELSRMILVPPTDHEVESARQYALGSLSISLSSQSGLASTLSSLESMGLGFEWLRDHPLDLVGATADGVRQAAVELFGPRRFTGIVQGDANDLTPTLAAAQGLTTSGVS